MSTYSIILSNPPHNDVSVVEAAPWFGLSAAEVNVKANYPAPEIWLVEGDASKLEETAKALGKAGLNVSIIEGDDINTLPTQEKVKSFAYGDGGFKLVLEDGSEVEIAYEVPMVVAYCQPSKASDGGTPMAENALTAGLRRRSSGMFLARDTLTGFNSYRRTRSSVIDGGGDAPESFIDVFVTPNGRLRRFSFHEKTVDFSGLGDLELPRANDNMAMMVSEFEDRFANVKIDRRLLDITLRKRPMANGVLLPKFLESISPDLKDLDTYDLMSRLVYLTSQ